jgi:hypothetical protein
MKYCKYLPIILSFAFLFLYSCSDNSTGPDKGKEVTVSGTIYGPDGSTPLPQATVYVPKKSSKNGAVAGRVSTFSSKPCTEPTESYAAYTCTKADGSFSFDVPVNGNSVLLNIKKGAFFFSKKIDVTGNDTDAGDIVMPSGDKLNTQIAVVTGLFDRMQDVLAKFGLGKVVTDKSSPEYGQLKKGTEAFDLYDGDKSLDNSYPDYTELLKDKDGDGKADLNNYDIIFINCGASEAPVVNISNSPFSSFNHKKHKAFHARSSAHVSKANSAEITRNIQALRSYVEDGGILYVTDRAYDYIEQVFPEFIDYYGSENTPDGEAEEPYAADVGKGSITTDAKILQPNLKEWLQSVKCHNGKPCLNEDGTIHIGSFLVSWAVMNGAHKSANVTFWVKGNVKWFNLDGPIEDGGSESGVRPLTVSFKVGKGQVIYSSYHTVEETEETPYWFPQERVLEYLVFE